MRMKRWCMSGIKYFFFLFVMFFSLGCVELDAAEQSETGNDPGVKKVELELNPGLDFAVPVWQALPGDDEWVFNYHHMWPDIADMTNVMAYGTMTLKAYPDDENFGTQPGWSDWKVETKWMVSGDSGVVMLKGGSYNKYGYLAPTAEEPEGTGCTRGYYGEDDTYYEETAIIIPTGKPGTVTVSAKVVDKNGKEIFAFPGKKITVKRWLGVNPDIKITEADSGRIIHTYRVFYENGGYGLTSRDSTTMLPQTYTGNPITPKIVITDKENVLKEGTDYTVSYENNVEIGRASILITGCGDYAGSIEKNFTIQKASSTVTESPKPETQPVAKLSCTGTYKKALDSKPFKLSVKNATGKVSYTSSNKKVATVNSSGVVTLKGTGLAKITVKASNGSVVSKVYVAPKKTSISNAKSTAKKTVTVTWKKDTKASGYEIQCNTSKKFKSGNRTVTVKKAKTTSAKVTKLKSGKKYYVRMRSYKTINGKKYAGSWSKVLTFKVK